MSFRENGQGEKCYRGEMSLGRNALIPFAGTIGSIMIYFLTAYSAKLVALDTQVYDMPIWKVALAIHIVCWILQFIGHGVFEGM